MIGARVVWDQRFTAYDFGEGHPMHPSRLALTPRLLEELEVLDDHALQPAEPATREVLLTVHTPELVEPVIRLYVHPAAADSTFGIGTQSTPALRATPDATALAL